MSTAKQSLAMRLAALSLEALKDALESEQSFNEKLATVSLGEKHMDLRGYLATLDEGEGASEATEHHRFEDTLIWILQKGVRVMVRFQPDSPTDVIYVTQSGGHRVPPSYVDATVRRLVDMYELWGDLP